MKFLKTILLITLVLISGVVAFAQAGGSLGGRVVTADGKPLSDVKVRLVSRKDLKTTIETVTDANGNYRFENVAEGRYLLQSSNRWGKVASNDSVVVSRAVFVRAGKNVEETIVLGNSIREEVTVIASAIPQAADEVSKSVSLIGGAEMRARADFALVETLKTVPGLRVQQLGGFGRTASIKTRGLRNQDTAILIDGIRFRDASTITGDASAFLSDITLTSVDRIEILRGSGSSLYGTNAIGGVVNFLTPSAKQGFHGQLSSALGGLGLGRVRGNASHGFRNFGYTFGISRTQYAKGIDGEDDAHNTNFQTRFDYAPRNSISLSGRIFVGDAYVRLNSSPDTIGSLPASTETIVNAIALSRAELRRYANGTPINQLNRGSATFIPDANDPDNFQKSDFLSGQFSGRVELRRNFKWNTSFQSLRTNRKNSDGILGAGFQPFDGNQKFLFAGRINTLDSHLDMRIGSGDLKIGYENEREKFGNSGEFVSASDNFFTNAKQSSNTIYGQSLFRTFTGRLQFSLAGRAQFFSLKSPRFTPRTTLFANTSLENPPSSYTGDATVSYFLNHTATKIRVHAGNGYRVPSLYERFGTFFFGDFFQFGNPALKPERSEAFDVGIDQFFNGARVNISATYFYTRLRDVVTFDPNAFNEPSYFNRQGGISRGAEFSGKYSPMRSTDISASYTFVNSDQRAFSSVTNSTSRLKRSFGIPVHQFSAVVTQRFGQFFAMNFDFVATGNYLAPIFSGETFSSYTYRFKGARRGDLSATYEIPGFKDKLRFRVYGTVENIFGYEYFENGFQTIGRTGRAGLGVNF